MQNKNITRTAAIIFSEDSTAIKSTTVQRKIIESVFVENENQELSIDQLIDYLKDSLEMDFEEKEIEKIVEDDKNAKFDIRTEFKTEEIYIKLEKSRFVVLSEREKQNSIFPHIQKFKEEIYEGVLSAESIDKILHNYFYQLLNKNIAAFKKISKPSSTAEDLFIDPNLFSLEEREAINEFLEWDESEKNRSIFALISYSLEYAVITNHQESSSVFLNSIKNKTFFLDNNVLYRAIGLNGTNRQNRILSFLEKCKSAGQEFKISKFSELEFRETIKYNIRQLQKVPFKKVNYNLFSKYSIAPTIYEYYHRWKADRSTYGFDLFLTHILSELDNFKKKFNVETFYQIPFDEKETKDLKIIQEYQTEIGRIKNHNYEKSHFYDAINLYLLEKLRGHNDNSISDTKYFFVSTDQKLRNWDFQRNDKQPVALLPSQWMTILLKYFSRSDNDYGSYISFLKLKTNQPIINEDDLQTILAGISEITQDFGRQESILDKMVELKFEGILDGNKETEKTYQNTLNFVSREYEKELNTLQKNKEQEIEELSKSKEEAQLTFLTQKLKFKEEILQEKQDSIQELAKQKIPIENQAKTDLVKYKIAFISIIVIYCGLIITLIIQFGWDKMEPVTYILGLIGAIIFYSYTAISGGSFNPVEHFEKKEIELIDKKLREFNFNIERFNSLITQRDELIIEVQEIKNGI